MSNLNLKVTACAFCEANIPASDNVCPECQRRVSTVPSWAQPSGTKRRVRLRRRLVWTALGLMIAVSIWFNYPFVPNPVVLLFKRSSSHVTSMSSPHRWSMQGGSPTGTNFLPDNSDLLQGRNAKSINLGSSTRSSAAIVDGVIYIGGDSKVSAIEIGTGQSIWETETTWPVHDTPAVACNAIYIVLLDKRVLALDLQDGNPKWEYKADAPFPGSVAVDKGIVYAGSQGGDVYALDAASGRLLWRLKPGKSVVPPPAVSDGKVFAASTSGVLFVRNSKTGDKRLRVRTLGSLVVPPVVGDGQFYVLSNGNLLALDADAKEFPGEYPLDLIWAQLWLRGSPVSTPPAQAGLNWRISPSETIGKFLFAPAVTPEALYLWTDLGGITALSPVYGSYLWRFQATARVSAPPMPKGVARFESGYPFYSIHWRMIWFES